MNTSVKISLLTLFLLFALPFFSSAHQTGSSWEKIVDGYKVDVGYDPTTIVAGQSQRFDFNIVDTKSGESVPFSDVWVRISQGQDTVFASGIHRLTFGLTGMIFDFPKGGDFNMNVRFENDDNTIVQTDLPINVIAGDSQGAPSVAPRLPWPLILIIGAACLVCGGALGFFMRKK